MRILSFVCLALGLMPMQPTLAQEAGQKPIVVVFEIEDHSKKLGKTTREQLTDYLVSLLSKGGFQVVPREQVRERMKGAKKESYKACYDQACQIELGRELAAQKSLASQVLKLGSQCKVTVNLYDLKSAASEKAGTASGGCGEDDIVASLETAVKSLVSGSVVQGSPTTGDQGHRPVNEIDDRIAAYKRGEHEHAYDIGMAFLNGQMGAKQNFTKAKQWFAKAAGHGDVGAKVELGDRYLYGQGTRENKKKAFQLYSEAAAAGNALGQENLARMYVDRSYQQPHKKTNLVKARYWYRKACEQDKRAKPCAELGRLLPFESRAESLKWYLKAAELGDDSVGPAISLIYSTGAEGVPKDLKKAQDCLLACARNGDLLSMCYLGEAYAGDAAPSYRRLGTEVNLVEAYKWLAVCVEKKPDANEEKTVLKKVADKMKSAELERAKKEAAELIDKYVTPQDREDKRYLETLPGR
jgi:uncharacterized protein